MIWKRNTSDRGSPYSQPIRQEFSGGVGAEEASGRAAAISCWNRIVTTKCQDPAPTLIASLERVGQTRLGRMRRVPASLAARRLSRRPRHDDGRAGAGTNATTLGDKLDRVGVTT